MLAQANSFDDDMIFDKSPLEENKDGNRLSHTQRNPALPNQAKPEPTEVNRDEYERIRIHLGAGANGDQPRLSDIFLDKETDRRRAAQAADPTNQGSQ